MLGGVPFASATGVEHDRLLQTERVVPISKDMRDTAPPRLTTIEQHSAFRDTLPHTAPDRFGTPRVLCVDDDPNLLQGLYRILGFDFDVVTDADAGAALRRLEVDSDFQVVLSDLRMPGIDGTRFLAETRRIVPGATRLLLTGVPDLEAAIAAINQGGVFRFLTKPCCGDQLLGAVHAAVQQHRLSLAQLEASAANTVLQQASPRRALRDESTADVLCALELEPLRARDALLDATSGISQTRRAFARPGSHLAVLAHVAEGALVDGRADHAARVLEAPLRALLKTAQAGRPTDPEDTELAAVLAARLAAATGDGTWIDYPFLLFCAIRRLLPSKAIDEVQKALHHVRRVNPGALELYISVLEFHGRVKTPTERCLLKRIQQCRALLPVAV